MDQRGSIRAREDLSEPKRIRDEAKKKEVWQIGSYTHIYRLMMEGVTERIRERQRETETQRGRQGERK